MHFLDNISSSVTHGRSSYRNCEVSESRLSAFESDEVSERKNFGSDILGELSVLLVSPEAVVAGEKKSASSNSVRMHR
nr:unnamed protein product [Callosobruchus chinensis]